MTSPGRESRHGICDIDAEIAGFLKSHDARQPRQGGKRRSGADPQFDGGARRKGGPQPLNCLDFRQRLLKNQAIDCP